MDEDSLSARFIHRFNRAIDLSTTYPDLAFVECRIILEMVLKDYYFESVGEASSASKSSVEEILGLLGKKGVKLPKTVIASTALIQQMGNYTGHDQGGSELDIDRNFVDPCLVTTRSLIIWRKPEIEDKLEYHSQSTPTVRLSLNDDTPVKQSTEPQIVGSNEIYELKEQQKTVRKRLREYVETTFEMGEEFRLSALKRGFSAVSKENTPNTISAHIALMTSNLKSRLSHNPKKDGSDDLLYRVRSGIYRRYDPSIDPTPIMPDIQPEITWSSKLLIVNAAHEYSEIAKSRCYLLQDTASYSIPRCAYVGLYSNRPSKGIHGVGNLVAHVRIGDEGEEPEISWVNDEEVPADTLCTLVEEQVKHNWRGRYPVQALIMGEIYNIRFNKNTPGKMLESHKVFDIGKMNHVSVEQIAEQLDSQRWSDFSTNFSSH